VTDESPIGRLAAIQKVETLGRGWSWPLARQFSYRSSSNPDHDADIDEIKASDKLYQTLVDQYHPNKDDLRRRYLAVGASAQDAERMATTFLEGYWKKFLYDFASDSTDRPIDEP
jgi:hypothetical protein